MDSKPAQPPDDTPKQQLGDTPVAPWEMPTPDEKAKAEPVKQAFSGVSTCSTASCKACLTGSALAFSSGVGISHGATGVSPSCCLGVSSGG